MSVRKVKQSRPGSAARSRKKVFTFSDLQRYSNEYKGFEGQFFEVQISRGSGGRAPGYGRTRNHSARNPLFLDRPKCKVPVMPYSTDPDRYFNAASHGLPASQTYRAMAEFELEQARHGPSAAAARFETEIAKARQNCARILNSAADRIGFSSTTSFAWMSLAARLDLSGKRVLVTQNEWGDYYRALAARADISIDVLPPLDVLNPDLSAWAAAIDDDVAAIFLPMVTSLSGMRYPVEAIAALPRPTHTRLIVDAAQALGQMTIDTSKIDCDAVVSTCRKWLCGPRQTALMWIADRWQENGAPLKPAQVEPADQSPALLVGLGAATEAYLQAGPDTVHQTLQTRADQLRSMAQEAGFSVFGGDQSRSAIVSLATWRSGAAAISAALGNAGFETKSPSIAKFEPLNPRGHDTEVIRIAAHTYSDDKGMARLIQTAKTAAQS